MSAKLSSIVEPTPEASMAAPSKAAISHLQDLAKAYQAIAAKNAERMKAAITELTQVKTPVEFLALQQKLMTEAMDAAIADTTHIVKLTAGAFTASFKPS